MSMYTSTTAYFGDKCCLTCVHWTGRVGVQCLGQIRIEHYPQAKCSLDHGDCIIFPSNRPCKYYSRAPELYGLADDDDED